MERQAIELALAGDAGVLVVEGEPGIGKSRLLAFLAERASGALVLEARASEFETDLPYAVFTEALDRVLAEMGERRLSRLGLVDAAALAGILPALEVAEPVAADRHRVHRALRDLLERLAASRPVAACFDDVHWADPASVDALTALVHRPPAGRVLLALAVREGHMPAALAAAIGGALREDRAVVLTPAPLTAEEAALLLGDAATAVYEQSGGNPFYLEQLARVVAAPASSPGAAAGRTSPPAAAATPAPPLTAPADPLVPPAVAAALAAELAALSPGARLILDSAAVVGDPFDPRLAAAVADVPESRALAALDELLLRALVRPAGAPGRFGFRHPVVRHAVYVAAPGGWRLGAHARAAEALERRGAGPVQRAHHVDHAATPGDAGAIALLTEAAEALQSPAPATAARFFAGALRLVPDRPQEHAHRIRLQSQLADAQAAGGDARAARDTLLAALRTATTDERLALTVGLTNQEWWLGDHEDARRRLHVELRDLPAAPSGDRLRVRLALGLMALLACDLADARAQWSDARDDARTLGDAAFEAAALAGLAVASVLEWGDAAAELLDESTTALGRLTEQQLATRLPALWMHGRARRALGDHEAALADLQRGRAMASRTGRERVLVVLTIESVPTLVELGRIADAVTAGEEGVELARLAGNPRMLLWAHCALSSARLAAGDVAGAVRAAQEATALRTRADVHAAGQPNWALGAALAAAGNPDRAVAALVEALAEVLPVDRPAAAADLAEAQRGAGEEVTAIEHGRAALSPWGAAKAKLAEGKALAAAGQKGAAIEALKAAEARFDSFGAIRKRDEAVRELRRLGHRVLRPAKGDGGPLTARELQIAELVAAGRTNREIAEQLVLSPRTIEAHLRNIYGKLGVRSRVELARAAD
jgi:DNA-binding CsgD family transcriptional regulator